MSLRDYFCPNGIFHLEQFEPSHSQQRLLRVLEIEQEASFWRKREHLKSPGCLFRRCQNWAEGLKTDSMKVAHGALAAMGALVHFLAVLKTPASHRKVEALWPEAASSLIAETFS